MQRSFKAEGVILKKRSLLGADTVIVCFTKEKGKIALIAKGIRSIKSRRISSLLTGNLIRGLCYQKAERFYLQDVQVISLFSRIRTDESKSSQLFLLLYILDKLLPEGQREDHIWVVFKTCLVELAGKGISQKRLLQHISSIITLFGYGTLTDDWNESIQRLEEIIGSKIPAHII